MEQIVVHVKDKAKAKVLFELLTALDFVDSVQSSETQEVKVASTVPDERSDFFSLAGLWQGRDVTLESIRQKAWPRHFS